MIACLGLFGQPGLPVNGQNPDAGQPSWPRVSLNQVANGLVEPTHITNARDGSGRLFLVERAGRIRLVKDGSLLTGPFLDITGRVGSADPEQGLLSVAFPPGYRVKGHFYVDYTDVNGNTVVARYKVTDNPDLADPASEEVILTIAQPYANHNGGQLVFGPNDGYLYIGMGDGGAGGDPENRAQNPGSLLGKILRIDVETGNPTTYTIPATNPFTQTTGYQGEIWALGLRNPWRFSFDDKTGDLYIGDVGQNLIEEIDFQPASSSGGENYGWRILEGSRCFNPATGCLPPDRYSPPVAEYAHSQDCSVTGGHVQNGIYFFGDFCSGRIRGLAREGLSWQSSLLYQAPFNISTFGEGEDGSLYVADYSGGSIYLIKATWLSYFPMMPKGA